ncbi:hypothetical protein NDU88_000065 [Pleurodeles waltl]|uniref:Uncharacterized protein n=1 Tax=Pleurodeles waltl TaxID=8319 RepID=A0AAV7UNY3_PLEWA|nr:hypothetical protein NDU88_000065 [Pleurodeles waltl]
MEFKPLKEVFIKKTVDDVSSRIAKRVVALQEYAFEGVHIIGKSNTVMDCLSRMVNAYVEEFEDDCLEDKKVCVAREQYQEPAPATAALKSALVFPQRGALCSGDSLSQEPAPAALKSALVLLQHGMLHSGDSLSQEPSGQGGNENPRPDCHISADNWTLHFTELYYQEPAYRIGIESAKTINTACVGDTVHLKRDRDSY